MPTHPSAFAAVAAGLAGIDPRSDRAVEAFYAETFPNYSEEVQALIFDWLACTVERPSRAEVKALVRAVSPERADALDQAEEEAEPKPAYFGF